MPDSPAPPDPRPGAGRPRPVSGAALAIATLALFLVWSHTFLAFEALLAPVSGPAPFDAAGLVVARYVLVCAVCLPWCLGFRRRESLEILRRHPVRLVLCGLLCVEGYNGFLYWGMERRVAGPIASVLTTLSPLYLQILGAAFLGERLTARKSLGLALGLAGVVGIATARGGGGASHALHVAVVAAAPLCWSVYTALTKPVTRTCSPVLWTYLVLLAGGLPLVLALPFAGGPQMLAASATQWGLLLFLALPATVFGFAAWSWLLRHLPASTVGLTVFLNPPLTTAGKAALSALLPGVFAFSISGQEWVGGAVALLGVAVAVAPIPRRRP